MRILFLSFLFVHLQVTLAVDKQAALIEPDRQPFVMEHEKLEEDDTIERVWGEPISEAEKLRARGIPSSPPTQEEMEMIRAGLETERRRDGRSIQRDLQARWPNGRVPYKLEAAFTPKQRTVIYSGFANIENNTCITFEPFEDTDKDWLEIATVGIEGCFADTRFREGSGKHMVGLQHIDDIRTCVRKGTVIHELLHILGVAHEQQRPDRDEHVTMHWENIQVDLVFNMWRDSWDTEDVANLKKCNSTGVIQAEADFSDCVSGDTVMDFGVGYDFKSVMHYDLRSFAVNTSLNVMTPKNSSITDVGNNQLSELDIKKLNYAYYCQGTIKARCGGSIYSPTGGNLVGKTLIGQTTCETLLKTNNGKGVELSIITKFSGTCEEDYLEVRIGGKDGVLIGKYCKGQDIPATLQVPTNSVFMVWKNTKDSIMKGTWVAYTIPACCDKLYWEAQFWDKLNVTFDGRDVYTNSGGKFLFWTKKTQQWLVSDTLRDDRYYYRNKINYFCPGALTTGWVEWSGSEWVSVGGASCSDNPPGPTANPPGPTANPPGSTANPPGPTAKPTTKQDTITITSVACEDCTKATTQAKPTTKSDTITITSVACEDCKNVLDGDMQGLYKLIKSGDQLCKDGCLYGKDGKVFCFVAGDQQVSLQCPIPTLF